MKLVADALHGNLVRIPSLMVLPEQPHKTNHLTKTLSTMASTPLRARWSVAVTLLLFVGFTTGCEFLGDDSHKPTRDIAQLVANTPSLNTLDTAVGVAGIASALRENDPITVFAPINSAFAKLGGTVDELLKDENRETLVSVLQYHVVAGHFTAADLQGRTTLTTLTGQTLRINTEDGVRINNAKVITPNIAATNGIVHLVDGVLLEGLDVVERAVITPALSTLVTAVNAAQLGGTLQDAENITVFAPTNEAFGRVDPNTLASLLQPANRSQLQDILQFHVAPEVLFAEDLSPGAEIGTLLNGRSLTISLRNGEAFVNDIRIIATDIEVSNGVVHLIENVLLP